MSGLKFGEESNSPLGCAFSPDTTVCGCVSSLIHVTVSPTLTSTGFGENAVSVRVEEPGTMETLVPSPALVALVPVVLPLVPAAVVALVPAAVVALVPAAVVALVPAAVVALVPAAVVALVPAAVVALVPAAVVALVPAAVVALVPAAVVALVPAATLLRDGGTSSISGLNVDSGGNPYC